MLLGLEDEGVDRHGDFLEKLLPKQKLLVGNLTRDEPIQAGRRAAWKGCVGVRAKCGEKAADGHGAEG